MKNDSAARGAQPARIVTALEARRVAATEEPASFLDAGPGGAFLDLRAVLVVVMVLFLSMCAAGERFGTAPDTQASAEQGDAGAGSGALAPSGPVELEAVDLEASAARDTASRVSASAAGAVGDAGGTRAALP